MAGNILITGTNGFIGANLVRRLLKEKKHNIFVFLRKTSNVWRINDILEKLNIFHADLLNFKDVEKAVEKINPDYIFHLATYGSYPGLQKDESKMIKTNIVGTFNLLKATENISYRCFINTGSSSEYGIKGNAISESDLLDPVNIYGASKASASLLCRAFSKTYKKNIVTLRPFSVYGPYEEGFRLIPYAIMNCLKKKKIKLTSGEQKRDFIFTGDVMDIYLNVMKRKGVEGKIFNVGTGLDYSVKNTVEIIADLTGNSRKNLVFGAEKTRKFEAVKSWKADTTQIEKVLNYKPKHTLKEGLKKTVEWFRKNIDIYKQVN